MTRRVITAREQHQLLAAWRKVGSRHLASPQFDWKESGNQEESRSTYSAGYNDPHLFDRWTAPLENGHWLEVKGLPHHNIGSGYGAIINLGGHPSDQNPAFPEPGEVPYQQLLIQPDGKTRPMEDFVEEEAKLQDGSVDGPGGLRTRYKKLNAHPTREHAIAAAERAYQWLFPLGTDTGGHDSGVDYSDLNKFMGEL